MEKNTTAASYNTQLGDRILWYDGDSTFKSDCLLNVLQHYDVRYVDEINEDVEEYNRHCLRSEQLTVKEALKTLSFDWKIPTKYKNLNVSDYVIDKFAESMRDIDQDDNKQREEERQRLFRVLTELRMYEQRGLYDVLRAIIYVINTLTTSNIVWGVGRGSSVSSYVLYLIGVHDVDSFAYNLDIEDFLHD